MIALHGSFNFLFSLLSLRFCDAGTSRSIGVEPVHQSRGTSSITWCMCTTSHNSFAHKWQGPPAFCWHKGGKAELVLWPDKCFEELAYLGRHGKQLIFGHFYCFLIMLPPACNLANWSAFLVLSQLSYNLPQCMLSLSTSLYIVCAHHAGASIDFSNSILEKACLLHAIS